MASGENKPYVSPKTINTEDDLADYPATSSKHKERDKIVKLSSVLPDDLGLDEEETGVAAIPDAPMTLLQLSGLNKLQNNAEEEPSLSSNGQDIEEVRQRLRNMLENLRRFLPMFEDLDVDIMDMFELQSSFMELRYLERALLDPEDYFEYVRYDGLEFPINPQSQEMSAFPLGEELTTECLICFDNTKLNKRLCCDFAACDSCMVDYIETKVNEGVVKIGCISDLCDTYIYRDEIIGRLPAIMKDKYYRFLVDANKDPMVKTCPRCSNIHHLADEEEKKRSKYGLPIICSECRFHWCYECQAPWHSGIKCKDFKKGDKLVKQWAKEKHYGETNAQKCPKCKIFIERRGGCDHMTCSKCDTSFCYRCGGRYIDLKYLGNHLSRYSPVGCKYNFQPDRPVLRRFVRGSVLGAKLLGGVLLLGIGVAAVGVLCGASVVIVPAFAGYKYHRHRKFKRQLKRQQELIKMRSNNAMMELHRERERNHVEAGVMDSGKSLCSYSGFFDDHEYINFPRKELPAENTEPIHIGIQTGHSQQVDVTVHNPYRPDVVVAEDDTQNSEIRMNITDERGQLMVTTAEISHNSNGADGSEAEIVLHVKTSYPKPQKMMNVKDESATTSEAVNEASSDIKNSDAEVKSTSSASESVPKVCVVADGRPKSAQIRRRVHSTGSLKKTVKKQEFGSISRKWRLRSAGNKSNDETDSPVLTSVHDQGHMSEENKHLGDPDQSLDKDGLTQSGCFIALLGKKLNTLQNHIEKEKVHNIKPDSNPAGEISNCPDIVSCALTADRKKDNSDNSEQNLENMSVEKDKYFGLVSTESSTTAL